MAALIGNSAFAEAGPATIAFVTAVAAGAIPRPKTTEGRNDYGLANP